jgi:hypothetical protein
MGQLGDFDMTEVHERRRPTTFRKPVLSRRSPQRPKFHDLSHSEISLNLHAPDYLKVATVAQADPKIIMAHCPNCDAERKAYVRGEHVVHWSDKESPLSSTDTGMILECCGCERIYFRRDYWFSEWEQIGQNPYTGELQMEGGVETTYWPAPVRRKMPEWIESIEESDETLGKLLSEMYSALNNHLRVLAAIGARTAFDRASEILGVDANWRFDRKLDELVTIGKIGTDDRETLNVLVDAGSAAAHRGWRPSAKEINTMMEIVEGFLYRAFVLGDGIQKLKAAVPPKPGRA